MPASEDRDLVEGGYCDHVFFKEVDESLQTPRMLTARGPLCYQDDRIIRIIRPDIEALGDPLGKALGQSKGEQFKRTPRSGWQQKRLFRVLTW